VLLYAFHSRPSTTLRIRSVVRWEKAFAICRHCSSGIIFSLKATANIALWHFLSIVCAIFFLCMKNISFIVLLLLLPLLFAFC